MQQIVIRAARLLAARPFVSHHRLMQPAYHPVIINRRRRRLRSVVSILNEPGGHDLEGSLDIHGSRQPPTANGHAKNIIFNELFDEI